jgi:Predicted AAA-ATPase/PD-(D/E)XK nuclease superfamily
MKNLPIGIQTFSDFPDFNFVYVDKTELIHQMTTTGKYYFLSRPRRFGKSLLISTLKALFEGKKDLFKGLWIEDKWDWSKKNPVIHFSFDAMSYDALGLDGAILAELRRWAKRHGVELTESGYKDQFKELIEKVSEKHGKVVILIDEYDKPIMDYLEFETIGVNTQAKINQGIMKKFYSVLKNAGDDVRFLFITGISKFSKVSLFSDLNNLTDLTLEPDYAAIVGYTQEELLFYFGDFLDATAEKLKISREELLEHIKIWYNGFSWDGQTKVYNPFGTLKFLSQKQFMSHWFVTGMPSFLMRLMKNRTQFDVENTRIHSLELEKYDIDNLNIVPLLFQTGYLTVKSLDPMTGNMVLDYPNKEVREGMYQFMIDGLAPDRMGGTNASNTLETLLKAFAEADLDEVKETINALLAGLPSEAFDKKSEGLYHGLLHFIFKLLGMYIKSEVHSSKGRADSIVETATHVFIFEFKFNRTADEAMQQIKDKKYADAYRNSGKEIKGIGVNFVSKDKEIKGWLVENV